MPSSSGGQETYELRGPNPQDVQSSSGLCKCPCKICNFSQISSRTLMCYHVHRYGVSEQKGDDNDDNKSERNAIPVVVTDPSQIIGMELYERLYKNEIEPSIQTFMNTTFDENLELTERQSADELLYEDNRILTELGIHGNLALSSASDEEASATSSDSCYESDSDTEESDNDTNQESTVSATQEHEHQHKCYLRFDESVSELA